MQRAQLVNNPKKAQIKSMPPHLKTPMKINSQISYTESTVLDYYSNDL